jgi:effector-binding domain-containing protein
MSTSAQPRIEHRELRHYVGVRHRIAFCQFAGTIGFGWPEVLAWLARRRLAADGAPLIRYCVLGDDATFEMELGVPVEHPVDGDGEVHAGLLPAGRYVVLRHVGPYDDLPGSHARLRRWADERGVAFDRWHTGHGEAWRASVEHYLVDPSAEPDPSKWEVELAYLTAG